VIDVENKVFNNVATALRTQFLTSYPNLKIYGEYIHLDGKFPCVIVLETGNEVYDRSSSLSNRENHANVEYSIAIYTNDDDKKQTAKKIAAKVDEVMTGMGFSRSITTTNPTADRTIYLCTMRYTGIVSKGVTVGTTTTHYVYKK